jgi:hypothetical protein
MLTLSRPWNHDRFNAVIFELIRLNMCGVVLVPGSRWDCYTTLGYLERRMRRSLIATRCEDGSEFRICDKVISFTDEGVFISKLEQPVATDALFV